MTLNLARFYESPDFNAFDTEQKYRALGKEFPIANYYGITVAHDEQNRFFLKYITSNHTLKKCKRTLEKVRKSQKVNKFIKEAGFNFYDVIKEENGFVIIDGRLFWSILLWLNLYEFTKAYVLMTLKIDFDHVNIPVFHLSRSSQTTDIVEWLGLMVTKHHKLEYLSYPSAMVQLQHRFLISNKNPNKNIDDINAVQHHKRNGDRIQESIKLWMESSGKEPFLMERDLKDEESDTHSRRYEHPNALLIYALNTYPMEVISLLNDIVEENDESPDFQINLSDTMVSKINDDFAYAKHDDLIVKFHIPTNYVHIRSTADVINKNKWTKHQDRFWADTETIEFITELNEILRKRPNFNYIVKKLEIQGCFISPSNPEVADSNMESAKTSEETDKVSDDLDDDTCNDSSENKPKNLVQSICSELKNHPSYFDINEFATNEFRGRYVHMNLFMFALFWLSKKRSIKYIEMINVLCHKSAIMNIKFRELMKKEIETLNACVSHLQEKNNELEKRFLEINHLNGSLKIKIEQNRVKLQPENYTQRPYSTKTREEVIIDELMNTKEKRDKIFYYVVEGRSNILTLGKDRNNFIINKGFCSDDVVKHIYNILDGTSDYEFKFNEDEYKLREMRFNALKSPQSYGYLFECEMSKKYNAFLYKDLPKSFISKFGLTNRDMGIDLVDIEHKKLYQCKCYKDTLTMNDAIQRSMDLLKQFQKKDPNYTLTLIVNEGLNVTGIDLPIIYEKTRLSETKELQTINDFISEHIDMKLKDLAKLIRDNYEQFSDGLKDISDAAISVRRQRLIKKINEIKNEENIEDEEIEPDKKITMKEYIINHPEMKPKEIAEYINKHPNMFIDYINTVTNRKISKIKENLVIKKPINEGADLGTINDYIKAHINDAGPHLLTFINGNLNRFTDGIKPLPLKTLYDRRTRLRKLMKNNDESNGLE